MYLFLISNCPVFVVGAGSAKYHLPPGSSEYPSFATERWKLQIQDVAK